MDNPLYQTREDWINAFINAARPVFAEHGANIPLNIRAGVGFPTTGYRSKVIGQCIFPSASSDAHFEIFLNPTVKNDERLPDARLADILTHELVHAAVNTTEHRAAFRDLARPLGLEGPLTATVAGANWYKWAAPILKELGPMPYGQITLNGGYKTKETYLKKLECLDCGFLAWTSNKHIKAHSYLTCPTPDCGAIMIAHTGDAE